MSAFTNSFIPKDTDGWWHSAPLARVRALMRKKHEGFGQGIVYTEEECMRLWDEGGIALPDDGGVHRLLNSDGILRRRIGQKLS